MAAIFHALSRAAVLLALGSITLAAGAQDFHGYTLNVKLLDDAPFNLLYASVIPAWEKRTGAKVRVLAQSELVHLVEGIKQDVAKRTVGFCLASNHTSFNAQFDNLYRDLTELLPPAYLAHFNRHVLDMARVNGRLVQLPHYSDISALYYNKALYASKDNRSAYKAVYHTELVPPGTWTELSRQAKFFSRVPGIYGTQFPGKSEPLTGRYYEMLLAEGGQLLDKNWRPTFNSPAGLRALNYFVDLYRSGAVAKNTPALGWNDMGHAFASGHVALDLDWAGWAHFYNDPKTSRISGQVGIVRAPKGSAGRRTGWTGSHTFSITKACDNPAAAADFLMQLTSMDAQLIEARQGKLVARDDAAAASLEEFERNGDHFMTEVMTTFAAGLAQDGFTPPLTPEWMALSDALWPHLQKAITGEVSQRVALRQAEKEVLALMIKSGRLR